MVSEGERLRNEKHDEPPRPQKCWLAGEGTRPVFGVIEGKGEGGHGRRLGQHLPYGSVAFNGILPGTRINVSKCVGSRRAAEPIRPTPEKGPSRKFALRGFSEVRSGARRHGRPP